MSVLKYGIINLLKQSKQLTTLRVFCGIQQCIKHRLHSSASAREKVINDKYFLKFEDRQVAVKDPAWEKPVKLPFIWLRDHCRCPECYDHTTNQRILDLLTIPDKIYPSSCNIKEGKLFVTWPDDHRSEYTLEWLWKNSYDGYFSLVKKGSGTGGVPMMWDNSLEVIKGIAKVPLSKYLKPGREGVPKAKEEATAGLVEVIKSLIRYGVAFVDEVPPTLEGTKSVVDQLALVKHTFFGGMFEFGDSMDHMDSAYTNAYIGSHTDNTYFTEATGLMALHCTHHEGTGGTNFLVDGMYAAERLRQKHPEAHACLIEEETEAVYVDQVHGRHYTACGPVLKYRKDTGQFVQIRFNLYDRAPLRTLPVERIPRFYEALKLLAAEIQDPKAAWHFKLLPGTVMLFDNWRVLHGRNEYTGRRRMNGCYIGHDDFDSTARALGLL